MRQKVVIGATFLAVWDLTPLRVTLDNVWSCAMLFDGLEFIYDW